MKSILILLILTLGFSCGTSEKPLQKARHLIDLTQYSEAISVLSRIISEKPNSDSAYILRGYANYMIGKKADSESDYHKVIANPRFTLTALLSRASAYFDSREYNKALSEFTNIIKRYPESHAPFYGRGMTKTYMPVPGDKHGDLVSTSIDGIPVHYDYEGAIEDLDNAIKLKPDYAAIYLARARAYERQNSLEQSLADLNKAITLDSTDFEFYLERGLIYKSLKKPDKAMNDFNIAIKLNPKDPFAFSNRGYLKREQFNDLKGACQDLLKAQELGLPMDERHKELCK